MKCLPRKKISQKYQIVKKKNICIFFILIYKLCMNHPIDQLQLNFSHEGLFLLNITLAFIMFGVALQLNLNNFKELVRNPRTVLIGIFSQFVVLPAMTFFLVYILNPVPSIALGMFLVAACPGGNISNYISSLAKTNTELSISLTAFSTVGAVLLTPLNFSFWAGLHHSTAPILREINISFFSMFQTVFVLLFIPLVAGMLFAAKLPKLTTKVIKPIRILSLLIFIMYIVVAFVSNFESFLKFFSLVAFAVFIHNALALSVGYVTGKAFLLEEKSVRTIAIETGIQNSGLGLVLIFNFFDGLGGMAYVAGLWGIWHLVAGLLLALVWSRSPLAAKTVVNQISY